MDAHADKREFLGRKIYEKRKACGFTQMELAERAGISTRTVQRLERYGSVNTSIDVIMKVAEALGTTAQDLLGGEEKG